MKRIAICVAVCVAIVCTSQALADDILIRYTVGGHVAALSEKTLDKAIDLSIDKDYAALKQLLDTKQIILLKKGIKVKILDTKIFSGKVKVRPFGTNLELWTILEALEKKQS